MRKYHQLLLLIVSVISLTLLLVYRHEYNRLHYVLEVFNFFGSPCNFSNLQESNTILTQHDWGPTPVWQEIEGGSYIYSSFWSNNEAKSLVYVENSRNIPRFCYLWYEADEPLTIGKFTYSQAHGEDAQVQNAYFYNCKTHEQKHAPHAISFTMPHQDALMTKKIPIMNVIKSKLSFNTTLCVAPSRESWFNNKFDKQALLEFISYHKLIGIDSFLIYENIPYRLVKLLTNLSSRLGYKITFLPWNFPKSNNATLKTQRFLIQNDCLHRTLNESKNVITLDLFEYIVPTKYYSFNELLADFNGQSEILSLPVQQFCIKNKNSKKPFALQNTRANKRVETVVYNVYRHATESNIVNSQILDIGFASIHKFIHCKTDVPTFSYSDSTILKYAQDLTRSTLVQLVVHDKI